MNENWRQDPRLKGMDEKKLKYLTELADKAGKTPKEKLTRQTRRAGDGNNGLDFNDQETELIVSILTSGMNPAQKKQVETLRTLSKRMGGGRR